MPNTLRTMIVALLLSSLLAPQPGWACAPAPRPGQFVRIAEESAIIIWDEKTRTWLAPYVAGHWKITAFKIAKDAGYREIGTSAVRMSFTTDRPFFPYREPADQREALAP